MLGPNIQGSINPIQSGAYNSNPNPAGAFSWTPLSNVGFGESGSYRRGTIGFNAHNSDTKYTDDGHVYPLSLALNFIIKT